MPSGQPGGGRPLDLFVVAGEVSGDHLGGKLMQALRDAAGREISFRGVGGVTMEKAGLQSLFPMADIAVMGFLPVIANLPRLLNRIRQTADAIIANPPDALIIIDSPDFTHRVARRVRAKCPDVPIIDYVSPTVWAWRPGRAARMRAYVDHLLALLPFEPRVHRELGGPACTYTGHPLIERLADLRPGREDEIRRETAPPLVVVLPGSRRSEIARLLAVFGETLQLTRATAGDFEVVLPAVDHLVDEIRKHVASWPIQPRIVTGEREKFAAFRQARAALAASGTVTLELGLAGVPAVVAYKVSRLEEIIARRLVKTKWMTLTNIILGEGAVPEFLQDDANPQTLSTHLAAIIRKGEERSGQVRALERLGQAMELPEGELPSHKAAQTVLDVIARIQADRRQK